MNITKTEVVNNVDFWALIISGPGQQNYFMIQDAHEYDEQDINLGMNSYYIEYKDQSKGGYGGIEKVNYTADKIMIEFSPDGAKMVGFSTLEIDSDQRSLLEEIKGHLIKTIVKHKIKIG